MLALTVAGDQLRRGKVERALGLVMIGNWAVALAVAVLLPFLWPVMILTILMPLVLSTPHLQSRPLVVAIGAALATAAIVGLIGLLNDDGGMIEDVDDSFELVVVVGALAIQIVPIALVVWSHNRLQRGALDDTRFVNDELQQSQLELERSRRRVVEAADQARNVIERDLHDGAQQQLVALGMRLRLLEHKADEAVSPSIHDEIRGLVGDLDSPVASLRDLAHGIYPTLLSARGVGEALRAEVRRFLTPIAVDIDEIDRHDPSVEASLYFIAIEDLVNAAKHADGAAVSISLTVEASSSGHWLVLQVHAEGPGFFADSVEESHGLANMRDRASAVGGTLVIKSGAGAGTTVTACLSASPETSVRR